MTTLFIVLIGLSILLGVWFVVDLGAPWRSDDRVMAWLLAAWGWVAVAFETVLLLALLRVRVPPVVFAVVLAAQDVVFVWRLRVQRARRRASD